MRFLADESCDFAIVRALRAAKHDVLAISEVSPGSTDSVVIGLSASEDRILLTEDKDFGQLVFVANAESQGVILFRFPGGARAEVGSSAVRLVETLGAQLVGRFVVAQPGRVRISGGR